MKRLKSVFNINRKKMGVSSKNIRSSVFEESILSVCLACNIDRAKSPCMNEAAPWTLVNKHMNREAGSLKDSLRTLLPPPRILALKSPPDNGQ